MSYRFSCFRTLGNIAQNQVGDVLHSNQWTVLHVTDKVVQQVQDLADQDGVQDTKDGKILFEWETGVPIQDCHADKIPMADDESNDTNIQTLGNVGNVVIIFGNEQDSEDDPGVLVTSNEERAEQSEQRDSNDGDEESIDMKSNDVTDVNEDSINKGVTKNEGEIIPGDVGQGDITDENENNIGAPTLEEDKGGDSDGISRSNRNKNPVRDYEPSFGGKTYGQQLFNVQQTKHHEQNKMSLQRISVNALFT